MSLPATTQLHVTGLTCNNCARKVTDVAQKIPGVHSVAVNLATERARVRWNSAEAKNLPAVLAAINRAGFNAREISAAEAAKPNRWQWNLMLSLAVTAALMLGEWIFNWMLADWFRWLSFFLAAGVQVFCGAQFYTGAWRQLKVGSSNMDTLVALGSTTAFGYSGWVLFGGSGGHVYFMEAAAIISLVSAGHWLEARVGEQASGALKSLLNLAPPTARRISNSAFQISNAARPPFHLKNFSFSNSESGKRKAEIETEVPVAELKIGDCIALRPGDRVPVDGVALAGESAVDEAMLTGESVPADKQAGSKLLAGTVNLNGRLILRVTATGEATALAHIIAAVQRAQTSRADIQRLGDRISNVFVPVIVTIALAAGIFWFIHSGAEKAFVIAAGVLIVACPCAMGLATPAAIMAAANAAARRGILIRDGVALEKAGKITAIIFDKTGTLTEGKPKVVTVQDFPAELPTAITSKDIIELAASLAALSIHPLSRAVGAWNRERHPLKDFKEFSGRGLTALYSNGDAPPHFLQLGSLRWLEEEGVSVEVSREFNRQWMNRGATVVGFAMDVKLVALIALQDMVKPKAGEVIRHFQDEGLLVGIISGDSEITVASIAAQLEVFDLELMAEVRPEQKADFVKKLQAQGERVAFVGDGINDAPALTQADLGIAVSRASDIAREAADIILLKSEIEAVPEALGLARATLRTIKQNLFWAFFYNALGVPLAASGVINPIFCAVAMGFSDLIVIGNALRLLRWKHPSVAD